MLVYLVRHGETPLNRERRLGGWTDVPLNDNGVNLAKVTGKALADVRFDAVFSSPLQRARRTAELVLAENAASAPSLEIVLDERIKEINFGTWEALRIDREGYELPVPIEDYRRFFTEPLEYCQWKGGESIRDVIARTGEFLRELAGREDLAEATVLVAMHGLAVRALLWHVYEDNSDFWHGKVPPNLAVNIVRIEGGEFELVEEDKVYYDDSLIPDFYARPETRFDKEDSSAGSNSDGDGYSPAFGSAGPAEDPTEEEERDDP